MNVAIRPYRTGERSGLTAAIDDVCGEGHWMSTRRFEPTPAWFHALEQPCCTRHLLLVVQVEQDIVGWCRLFPKTSCNEFQPEVNLGIGLLASYRNTGIGTALVSAGVKWAVAQELPVVSLLTLPDNRRAIRVFEKCGFTATGQIQGNLIKMMCNISSPRHVSVTQGEGIYGPRIG
jgi:RimJ/RimL family protein N-acetyltransferase